MPESDFNCIKCRFTIERLRETAFHTGRPLFKVGCKTHGLIHPATTGPDHSVNFHLEKGEVWEKDAKTS